MDDEAVIRLALSDPGDEVCPQCGSNRIDVRREMSELAAAICHRCEFTFESEKCMWWSEEEREQFFSHC